MEFIQVKDYFNPPKTVEIRMQTQFPDHQKNFELRQRTKEKSEIEYNYDRSGKSFKVEIKGEEVVMTRKEACNLLGLRYYNPNFGDRDFIESKSRVDGKKYIIREI